MSTTTTCCQPTGLENLQLNTVADLIEILSTNTQVGAALAGNPQLLAMMQYLLDNDPSLTVPATDSLTFDVPQYGVSTTVAPTTVNPYIVTLVNPPTSLITGMQFSVLVTNGNGGAVSINFNGLGSKFIFINSTPLIGGEIAANQIIKLTYDGTNFQLESGTSTSTVTDAVKFDVPQYGTSSTASPSVGSPYIVTLASPPAILTTGMAFDILVTNGNASSVAININGLGIKNIFKNGNALIGGEIVSGQTIELRYDGTQFELKNPSSGALPSSNAMLTVKETLFTSSGTYTPTAGLVYAIVEAVGGGGAGGGAAATGSGQSSTGAGGGSGAICKKIISAAAIGASQAITIGLGGTGVSGAGGNSGGNTTFGAILTAGGGPGGSFVGANSGGGAVAGTAGGTGTGGDLNIQGGSSGASLSQTVPGGLVTFTSGNGGSNQYGAGAAAVSGYSTGATGGPGVAGSGYGSGGSGAANATVSGGGSLSAQPGGAGSPGMVLVTEFILVGGGFNHINIQIFTSSGAYTPSVNLLYSVIEGCGGGGGGGGSQNTISTTVSVATGGSGAGYFRRTLTAAQIGVSGTVTIGLAGIGGAANSDGTGGGNTTFVNAASSITLTANGGGNGRTEASNTCVGTGPCSGGGTATGGDLNINGTPGTSGVGFGTVAGVNINSVCGGNGGGSLLGGGANGTSSGAGVTPSTGNGGGGSGAATGASGSGSSGGNGTPGILIITEYTL